MKGAAQMAARPQLAQDMDSDLKEFRAGLKTPESQLQFDSNTRRYRQMVDGRIGESAERAVVQYGIDTNTNSEKTIADSISNDYPDDQSFQHHLADLQQVKRKTSDLRGLGKAGADAADVEGAASAWKTRLGTMIGADPDKSLGYLAQPDVAKALGTDWAELNIKAKDAVSRRAWSQMEQIEATDPTKAVEWVQGNQARLADRYGAALKQASASHKNAEATRIYDGMGVAPPAPPAGATPQSANPAPGQATNALGARPADFVEHPVPGQTYRADQIPAENVGPSVSGVGTPGPSEAHVARVTAVAAAAPQFHQKPSVDQLFGAFHGQESGAGAHPATSVDNAHGDMQIQPATFRQFAKPGEQIDNRADNIAVGKRILAHYNEQYGGDPERVAVAYFSGPGNVAPAGSPTPWVRDAADGNGKRTSSYVADIMGRLGRAPSVAAGGVAPAGHDVYGPAGPRPSITPADLESPGEGPSPETPTLPVTPASLDATQAVDKNAPEQPEISDEAKITIAAQKMYHDKLAQIEGLDVDDDMKVRLGVIAQRRYTMEMAEAGLVAAQREARERAVTDDVLGIVRKNDVPGAYARLDQYVKSHQVDNKFYDTMSDVIEQRTQVPNPASVGSKYQELFKRMLLPDDDPDKLRGRMQIFQAEGRGEITRRGADLLIKQQDLLPSSHDEYGYAKNNEAQMDYMKRHLVRENAYPGDKSVDQKGYDKLDTQAIPLYNSQYDKWHRAVQEGVKGTPDTFPLWDKKNLDAFLETVYSRRERENDALGATAAPEEPGTAFPSAPQGFSPQGWATLMQQAPQLKGGGFNHLKFGNDIENLAANPKEMIPLWNASPLGQRFMSAERVLDLLGVSYGRDVTIRGPEVRHPDTMGAVASPDIMEHADWRSHVTSPRPREAQQEQERSRIEAVEHARQTMAPSHATKAIPDEDWRSRAMSEE